MVKHLSTWITIIAFTGNLVGCTKIVSLHTEDWIGRTRLAVKVIGADLKNGEVITFDEHGGSINLESRVVCGYTSSGVPDTVSFDEVSLFDVLRPHADSTIRGKVPPEYLPTVVKPLLLPEGKMVAVWQDSSEWISFDKKGGRIERGCTPLVEGTDTDSSFFSLALYSIDSVQVRQAYKNDNAWFTVAGVLVGIGVGIIFLYLLIKNDGIGPDLGEGDWDTEW